MYNTSNNSTIQQWYKDAVYNHNRKLLVEFYINGNLIDNSYLLDKIEIEHDCMSDGYTIGQIIYPKIIFSLYKDITIFEGADVSIFISLEVFNTSTNQNDWIRIPFGVYKVIEIEETRLQKKCTGYCQSYKQLQFPFIKNEKNQYTSTELLAQITSETGIEFEGFPNVTLMNEDIVTKTQNEDGTETEESREGENFNNHSYASIIALVAGACGGNAIFSREGKIKLVKGTPKSDVAILGDLFTEPTTKPTIYQKKQLQVVKRSDIADIKVGEEVVSSNQTLVIQNPLMSQETATTALSHISTVNYKAISTTLPICPLHLEPLDSITLYVDDEEYILPLQKYKLIITGNNLSAEVESFVPTEVEDGYKGSLTTQIGDLQGQVATMSKLVVGSIVAGDISALTIKVDELTANVAKVNQLIANGITSDQIQSYNLTSKNTTIENALIKDSMIENVSASKIMAGQIDTGAITIGSKDGKMIIADETIQISDGSHVRVQIGQTANGDYALVIYDKNGGVMFDATGITERAIKSAIIRDNMISPQANINAKKLNIQSLFTQMNKDGSNTLKASKIFLDTEQQTLNIAFNQMTTKQELLTEKTNTLTTQLNTQQGQIDTLIKNTTITDDGQTTTLKDAYSQFVQTQNGFNLKVEEHESKFNNLKIGTRNYLANTGTPFTMTGNNTTNQTSTMYHFVNKDNSPIIGGEATFAFKYKIEEGATGAVRIQTNGAKTGDATEGKWFNLYRNDNITTMENEGQVVYTRTYNESDLNTFTGVSIRLDNFVGSITVSECSMVVGNEFGGWQPAPEDTGEALSSLETRVSSAEQQVTKDAIISKVSSTFVKQTDFDNMTIGGRNLIVNSNFYNGFTNWNGNTDKFSLTDDNVLVYNQTGISKPQNYQLYTDAIDVSDYANKELTLTFVYNVPNTSLNTTPIIACVMFFEDDTSTTISQAVSFKYLTYGSDYVSGTRAKYTSTIIPSEDAKFVRIYTYMSQNGKAYWTNFQLEVGNVATDWSPSPKDTEESLSVLETRVQTAESKITKDAIINTVSGTYVKQTDFNDAINQPIGTTNRVPNSAPTSTSGWTSHTTGWSRSLVDCSTSPSGKAMRASLSQTLSTGGMYKTCPTLTTWEHGEQYTMSCWMRASNNAKIKVAHDSLGSYTDNVVKDITTEWQYFTSTGTFNSEATYKSCTFYITTSQPAGFWFEVHSLKVEKGNKATDWSPAPEDTINSISSLETRMNTAEQQITKDAIISKVSSTFVKQTDFNNLTIGGENLIINSNFYFGFENWQGSTTQYYITEDNTLGYNQLGLTEAKNYQVYTKPIDVSNLVGKEVTVSFDYKIINKTQQSTISIGYIRFFDAEHEGSNAQADSIAYKTLNLSNNYVNGTVERAMATVTVPQNAKYARVGAYQSKNGQMFWSNFQLEVGNKATAWKPNSFDIKLYADNSNDMLKNELNDLKNIADLSNNADSISPDMKTKLIAECEDAESVYNKLIAMYEVMGSPVNYKSLFTNMKNSFSTLSSEILYLKSSQNEISESGLGDLLQLFNNFYTFAEELNKAILNSLKGITDSLSTEIKQLASSVEIKINEFSSELGSISTHFIFDTNGLTIKSSADSTKYIKLDNDSLDFMDNGNKVAEITNQQLNITKAEIKSNMKIGNMKIKPSGSSKNGVVFVFE